MRNRCVRCRSWGIGLSGVGHEGIGLPDVGHREWVCQVYVIRNRSVRCGSWGIGLSGVGHGE